MFTCRTAEVLLMKINALLKFVWFFDIFYHNQNSHCYLHLHNFVQDNSKYCGWILMEFLDGWDVWLVTDSLILIVIRSCCRYNDFKMEFLSLLDRDSCTSLLITLEVFDQFLWNYLKEWDLSLLTSHSTLVPMRIVIQICEFINIIFTTTG